MKIISLNIVGGTFFEPLIDFISAHAADTDIFCFQEVVHPVSGGLGDAGWRKDILEEIAKVLPDHTWYFTPAKEELDLSALAHVTMLLGKATFVRKTISVASQGVVALYQGQERSADTVRVNIPTNFHYVRFLWGGRRYMVGNVHGIVFPGDKLDTPERIDQSEKIKAFFDNEQGVKILCGDFNLMPQTRSITLLEEGMTNLIKKFDIKETRGRLHKFFGKPDAQHFADYAFVSPDIKVNSFTVPDVGVSDHLPMILDLA